MIQELIENGQYKEALSYLTDREDEQTRYLRLVCLNALGEYQLAKNEGAVAKAMAGDTYYDVVAMYLTSLKECEEYEEAIDLLVEELSMPYIPASYEQLFNAAYDEILREKQEQTDLSGPKKSIFSIEEIEVLLKRDVVNDDLLYMALDQLAMLNVRRIMPTIRNYLMDEKKPPFSKTIIIEILIEQQIDEEMTAYKYGSYYDFNPSYQPLVLEQLCYQGIGQEIVRVLEDDNPSLMHQCLDYLEYYLYAIYPRTIDEEDYRAIAGAIHYYLASLQYIDLEKEDIEMLYAISIPEIENQLLALQTIEC